MRTSIPTALMAALLLSDTALARRKRTAAEITCQTDVTTITVTVDAASTSTSPMSGTAIANGTIANATSTVPFFTIQTTGSLTLSTNSTSTVPFFTLQTTGSLPLPTGSTSIVSVSTQSTSVLAPSIPISTPSISVPVPSASISTLTTLITPPSTSQALAPATSSETPDPSSKPTSTTSSSHSITSTSSSSTSIPFLRGVNLGGWLVLESWMDGDLFSGSFSSAVDQYTFDKLPGAAAALQSHWQTYITESDISSLAATGINALRIPIGFWAYDNANTPYLKGADQYLEQAIGWARTYGMKVWVDCHGSPGSQNGFDNSGQAGQNTWQQGNNLQRSISVLQTMAAKYGALEYADVVVGLELTNEPISYGNNLFSTTQSWTKEAYAAVRAAAQNKNLVVVMHDAFQTPLAWLNVGEALCPAGTPRTFGVDTHLYGLFTPAEDAMTQAQHITQACGWAANLKTANAVLPTYVGEWSAATNICVNPDGSTTAGTSCSVAGCQCQSADFADWNDNMIAVVRKYVEAQLDVFESSSSGYFMWAAKGPGGWGFLNGIQKGIVPNPVTSRKYGSQCGGSTRREVRGSLGVGGELF